MKKIYLLATIVAIITGIVVYVFVSGLENDSPPAVVQYEMISVVAAVSDIPANTKITKEMLTLVEVPKESVPSEAVRDMGYLVGKTTKYPVSKGEQLFFYKAAEIGDNENDRLSDRIRTGYRAYTIFTDEVAGLAGYLRVGDRVDIMVTMEVPVNDSDAADTKETTKVETGYFLQNVPIIAVGSAAQYASGAKELNSYTNITLEIPAEDCVMLEYNITKGFVRIVLRGFGDEVTIDVSGYPD